MHKPLLPPGDWEEGGKALWTAFPLLQGVAGGRGEAEIDPPPDPVPRIASPKRQARPPRARPQGFLPLARQEPGRFHTVDAGGGCGGGGEE